MVLHNLIENKEPTIIRDDAKIKELEDKVDQLENLNKVLLKRNKAQ